MNFKLAPLQPLTALVTSVRGILLLPQIDANLCCVEKHSLPDEIFSSRGHPLLSFSISNFDRSVLGEVRSRRGGEASSIVCSDLKIKGGAPK